MNRTIIADALRDLQNTSLAPPVGVDPIDADALEAEATEKTANLLTEAVELQRQRREREAIERFLTAYDMELPPVANAELHLLAGNGFARLSEFEQAEGQYRQALAATKEAGDPKGQANALAALAAVYESRGDLAKAKDYLDQALAIIDQALAINDEIGAILVKAQTLVDLGRVAEKRDDGKKAVALLEEAVALYEAAGIGEEAARRARKALAQLKADTTED